MSTASNGVVCRITAPKEELRRNSAVFIGTAWRHSEKCWSTAKSDQKRYSWISLNKFRHTLKALRISFRLIHENNSYISSVESASSLLGNVFVLDLFWISLMGFV